MQEALTYTGYAGQHISNAAVEACNMACEYNQTVILNFNAAKVEIEPGQLPEVVVAAWEIAMAENAKAYRNSPEGIRAAQESAARLQVAQAEHDRVMALLPTKFFNARAAIEWLTLFSGPADNVGLKGTNFSYVADVLEHSGWKDGDACNLPEVAYENPDVMGRWIIGQAINMLRTGMPPHPMLMNKFAPQFLEATN